MLAREDDPILYVKVKRELLQFLTTRSVSNDAARELAPSTVQERDRAEERVMPLLRSEPCDDADDPGVLGQAKFVPRRLAGDGGRLVDAVGNRAHLARRGPVVDHGLRYHRGDTDDPRRRWADHEPIEHAAHAARCAKPDVLVDDQRTVGEPRDERAPRRAFELVDVQEVARPDHSDGAGEFAR